ncbi:MAG: hypothetical protein M5U19_09830 [Microthrixaceae bacterium]|nr:hypothetical protein [Microthrixaceae bacterium]
MDEAVPPADIDAMAPLVSAQLGAEVQRRDPARTADLDLRAPRVVPPGPLEALCSSDVEQRAGHSYGKSFRDVVRGFRGEVPDPPTWWCSRQTRPISPRCWTGAVRLTSR